MTSVGWLIFEGALVGEEVPVDAALADAALVDAAPPLPSAGDPAK